MLGHGVGAEQGERQRLAHVPGELVAGGDAVDLRVVGDRVELLDPALPVVAREPATGSGAIVTVSLSRYGAARSVGDRLGLGHDHDRCAGDPDPPTAGPVPRHGGSSSTGTSATQAGAGRLRDRQRHRHVGAAARQRREPGDRHAVVGHQPRWPRSARPRPQATQVRSQPAISPTASSASGAGASRSLDRSAPVDGVVGGQLGRRRRGRRPLHPGIGVDRVDAAPARSSVRRCVAAASRCSGSGRVLGTVEGRSELDVLDDDPRTPPGGRVTAGRGVDRLRRSGQSGRGGAGTYAGHGRPPTSGPCRRAATVAAMPSSRPSPAGEGRRGLLAARGAGDPPAARAARPPRAQRLLRRAGGVRRGADPGLAADVAVGGAPRRPPEPTRRPAPATGRTRPARRARSRPRRQPRRVLAAARRGAAARPRRARPSARRDREPRLVPAGDPEVAVHEVVAGDGDSLPAGRLVEGEGAVLAAR